MTLESFLIWVALGLVAGAVAKFLMPGRQGGGCLLTIILGVVGSFVGGWVGQRFFDMGKVGEFSIAGITTAVAGALLILFLFGLISKKS